MTTAAKLALAGTLLSLFIAAAVAADSQDSKTMSSVKPTGILSRWIEIQTANLGVRYRFIQDSAGVFTSNHLQHQEVFRGRFLFDPEGRYGLNAVMASGSNFTGSWNNTGWGGEARTNIYLRQLFLSAAPTPAFQLQFGGFTVVRGESTEITTYDNDAFAVGARMSLRRPQQLFFDEVTVTYGYLGDLGTPDLRKRFNRLQQSNYHQFLVLKRLGKRASVSGDYTFQWGIETLRQAIKLDVKEVKLVDSIRYENYQRLDVEPDFGFAVQVEKELHKRFSIGGGFADIDPSYGGLNADRFDKGRRFFLTTNLIVIPDLTFSTFFQRAVATDFAIPNRMRFELVFTYNVIPALKSTGLF